LFYTLFSEIKDVAEEAQVYQMASTRQGEGWRFSPLVSRQLRLYISVATAPRTLQHQVFVFETYIETKSVTAVQRCFRIEFIVEHHGNIPGPNTILRWFEAFTATGSVTKRKPPGLPATVHTPENNERVRVAVLRSPRCSAWRQALALQMLDRSICHSLHKDLKFHPYKIMIVQRLLQEDFAQRRQFCETLLDILDKDI
jgi:hypothetical protein